eukprot:gene17825-22858_t
MLFAFLLPFAIVSTTTISGSMAAVGGTERCPWECGLNGRCGADGECTCYKGWKGKWCTALDVIAVDRNNGVYSNDAMPTWGGNAVRGGEADGRLHMWVGARAEPSTPLASNDSYTCNSKVVHLVESKSGPGGSRFELASPQPLALGRMHYSPNTIKIPGGGGGSADMYLMFSCGNPQSPPINDTYCAQCWLTSSESIRLSWSNSVDGPWGGGHAVFNPAPGPLDRNSWDCTTQNPSVVILANGTVIMAYRGHRCVDGAPWPAPAGAAPSEYIGIATAPHWSCLVNQTCTLMRATPKPLFHQQCPTQLVNKTCNVEDPFLWIDNDGFFHMLMHGRSTTPPYPSPAFGKGQALGIYAYSRDGLDWTLVTDNGLGNQTDASPWPTDRVQWTDGSSSPIYRRQKPSLLFDVHGNPTHLVNGVDTTSVGNGCYWQTGYTLIQPLRVE